MTKAYDWWKHENNLPFFFCARKRWENKLAGPFPSFPCCRNLLNSILELGRYALLTPSPPFISHLPVVNFFFLQNALDVQRLNRTDVKFPLAFDISKF